MIPETIIITNEERACSRLSSSKTCQTYFQMGGNSVFLNSWLWRFVVRDMLLERFKIWIENSIVKTHELRWFEFIVAARIVMS